MPPLFPSRDAFYTHSSRPPLLRLASPRSRCPRPRRPRPHRRLPFPPQLLPRRVLSPARRNAPPQRRLVQCSRAGELRPAKAVHALAVLDGLSSGVFVSNSLLSISVQEPNMVVFNTMIAGFCRTETAVGKEVASAALTLYSEVQSRGIQPTEFTFSSVLRACNITGYFEFGKQIHSQVLKHSFQGVDFIRSALIDLTSTQALWKTDLGVSDPQS
ncbi:hypothetical protein GUJ93_ZPchr0001g31858 [Zizania palustris]|uniref:Uncharacterized protein n=1 Tax=Zizania palustris TaxID=103762 RepID=A0A8J5RP90_ZIZPA|nr:hypothetical protein GUJ93_ZPchr0001g31858 [Zizania palustris]